MENKVEHNNGFPDPRCQLFFQEILKHIAGSVKELSQTQMELAKTIQEIRKIIHGENFDNGLNLQVITNTKATEENQRKIVSVEKKVEQKFGELENKMLRWGFFLLGGQTVITGIFTTGLFFILRSFLQ